MKPDLTGKSREEAEGLKQCHRKSMKEYKQALMTPNFADKYLNNQCESPLPNTLVCIEEYDRLLAAHLHQIGPQIPALLNKVKGNKE